MAPWGCHPSSEAPQRAPRGSPQLPTESPRDRIGPPQPRGCCSPPKDLLPRRGPLSQPRGRSEAGSHQVSLQAHACPCRWQGWSLAEGTRGDKRGQLLKWLRHLLAWLGQHRAESQGKLGWSCWRGWRAGLVGGDRHLESGWERRAGDKKHHWGRWSKQGLQGAPLPVHLGAMGTGRSCGDTRGPGGAEQAGAAGKARAADGNNEGDLLLHFSPANSLP